MNSQDYKKLDIPDVPGVYFFKKGGEILYIGKATSLRDRVKSYFSPDLIETRGPVIVDMIFKSNRFDFIKTDSVLEALILENNLIKKHQPKYNTKEKDNRSYNYVIVTSEDFPRVLIERGRKLENEKVDYKILKKFGPYPNGSQLKEALKIIRKIFPFRDKCRPFLAESKVDDKITTTVLLPTSKKACFNKQIGLCPGVCDGSINKKDYKKIIKNIILFLEGKKTKIIKNLQTEMVDLAKNQEFEKADKIKKTFFALQHIQDISLLKVESLKSKVKSESYEERISRIEAYDMAHFSGESNVGVMVVLEDGVPNKNEYRRFRIKESKQNDIRALKEILERRLNHEEWKLPDFIVVDGGKAQINITRKVINNKVQFSIPVVSVVKNERHKPRQILGDLKLASKYEREILLANSEAHRFAIKYHRSLRRKMI